MYGNEMALLHVDHPQSGWRHLPLLERIFVQRFSRTFSVATALVQYRDSIRSYTSTVLQGSTTIFVKGPEYFSNK